MQTLNSKAEKRAFYRLLLVLTLPIVLQNLIDACVGAADTVMLNYVSQSALSAVSLANNVHFVNNMFLLGLCSGASVMIAQYWGRGDMRTIERTIGITMRYSLIVGAIFSIVTILAPDFVIRIFTDKEELIPIGTEYLRIVGIGYLINSFTQVYVASQRAMEKVKFGVAVNLAALLTNVILNACFIFGLAFFPKLDVIGVAIATTISRIVAALICVFDACRPSPVRLRLKYLFERNQALFRDYAKYTLPALGNDFAWGLGFSAYSIILGHLSSDCVAANTYANTLRNLSTVVCFAVANAAAIIMGKTMGENRLEDANVYAKRLTIMSIITGLTAGVIVLISMPFLLSFAKITPLAKDYLKWMLVVSVPNVAGQSLNTMLICGIYRAGGDTKFGMIVDLFVMWAYAVALGYIAAFVLKLPVIAVYAIMFLDEIVKMPFVVKHFAARKWLKNITHEMN